MAAEGIRGVPSMIHWAEGQSSSVMPMPQSFIPVALPLSLPPDSTPRGVENVAGGATYCV